MAKKYVSDESIARFKKKCDETYQKTGNYALKSEIPNTADFLTSKQAAAKYYPLVDGQDLEFLVETLNTGLGQVEKDMETKTNAANTYQTKTAAANDLAAAKSYADNLKFKTINGQSIKGDGNIQIEGGGGKDISFNVSGSGNVVSAISDPDSDGKVTVTKGVTALTSHQSIYSATFAEGKFTGKTFNPKSAAATINVPTKTSHLTNDSNFATTSDVNACVKKSGGDTITGNLSLANNNGAFLGIRKTNQSGANEFGLDITVHSAGTIGLSVVENNIYKALIRTNRTNTFLNVGNVVIGSETITPTYKLHVVGDIYATGKIIAAGGVQQASASSFATMSESQSAGLQSATAQTQSGRLRAAAKATMSVEAGKQYFNDEEGKVVSEYLGFKANNQECSILSTKPMTFTGANVITENSAADGNYYVYTLRYMQVSETHYVITVSVKAYITNIDYAPAEIPAEPEVAEPMVEESESMYVWDELDALDTMERGVAEELTTDNLMPTPNSEEIKIFKSDNI